MRKWIRPVAVIAATLLALGGLWISRMSLSAQAAQGPRPATAPGAAPPPRSVEVVSPERGVISRVLDAPATIEAFEQTDAYAKVSGYVAEVRVDIGDHVRAGDTLAVIDVPELSAELDHAEAVLAAKRAYVDVAKTKVLAADLSIESARNEQLEREAEVELQRITTQRKEELIKGQAITPQEFDEARIRLDIAKAQANVAAAKRMRAEGDQRVAQADRAVTEAEVGVAEASVARLRILRDYTVVKAPFDGVIAKRMVDRGALVQAATASRTSPLFSVHRVDRLRVQLDVPESDVAFVHPGVPAKVKPYGLRGDVLAGTVVRIAASLNPSTRTMRSEIDLANADGRLYDGMYAQVTLQIDPHADALTIPATALWTEGKEMYVFTVRDTRAVRTPVQTGLDDGIRVEVTSGLDDTALVIVTGKGLVADGMSVVAVRKGTSP